MEGSARNATILLVMLVLFPTILHARHLGKPHPHHRHHHRAAMSSRKEGTITPEKYWDRRPMLHRKPDTLQIAGSSLPDCSHACGSCTPCRLVMVSFVCSTLQEAETCPMAYKCMCRSKSFPVP